MKHGRSEVTQGGHLLKSNVENVHKCLIYDANDSLPCRKKQLQCCFIKKKSVFEKFIPRSIFYVQIIILTHEVATRG